MQNLSDSEALCYEQLSLSARRARVGEARVRTYSLVPPRVGMCRTTLLDDRGCENIQCIIAYLDLPHNSITIEYDSKVVFTKVPLDAVFPNTSSSGRYNI